MLRPHFLESKLYDLLQIQKFTNVNKPFLIILLIFLCLYYNTFRFFILATRNYFLSRIYIYQLIKLGHHFELYDLCVLSFQIYDVSKKIRINFIYYLLYKSFLNFVLSI